VTQRGPTDYPAAPRLARWLLALRVPREEREFVVGDLEEGRAAIAATSGAWHARRWYWQQVFSMAASPWGAVPAANALHTGGITMGSWLTDLRTAMRSLRRAPLFATLVTLTLAIGIGATSAVFSVVYPIVLAEPPYPGADRLVMVWERSPSGDRDNIGYATGDDIRRETAAFQSFAMTAYWAPIMAGGNGPEQLTGARVTHEYFSTLGVRPMLGRDFTAEEDTPATRRVVILSHGLWTRLFGGDSSVVGREATVNGTTYLVAGVMPAGFRDLLSPQAELWSPLGYEAALPWACRTCHHLRAVGRLRDGVTLTAATLEIDAFMHTLRERHPTEYGQVGALVPTLKAQVTGDVRAPLLGLFGAVLLLLLLACTNVANLFLGRTGERQGDLTIRMALGARRGRLVRLVALEAVLLAALGGAAGILAAFLGTRLLLRVMAVPDTLAGRVDLSLAVVMVALVATTLAALLGGALPALLALGESALADIRMGARSVVGRTRHRLRNGVVIAEVAIAALLLAGAGLQVRSLQRALAVDTGFEPDGVLSMAISVVGPRYNADGAAREFYRDLLREAAGVPGVEGVALVNQLPLGGNYDASGVHREDRPAANPEEDPSAQRFAVSTDYLAVMGIRVLRGRGFTAADRQGSEPVILLNRSGAERIFGTVDPLGKRIKIGGMDGPWRTVVGIVDDVRHLGLEAVVENQMYLPFDQNSYEEPGLTLVARVTGRVAGVARPLTALVRQIDPDAAVSQVRGMPDVIGSVVAPRRLALSLVGGFAAIALVLALGGLYGVMAAGVAERTREIGVRAALGATPGGLVRLVVRRGLGLTLVGAAIGTAGFLAARGVVGRFVFGVSPSDPLALAAMVLLLGVVAVLASVVPAARAARVDPQAVLRE